MTTNKQVVHLGPYVLTYENGKRAMVVKLPVQQGCRWIRTKEGWRRASQEES